MAPHVDRHIDRRHATTHNINAEDEVLLTSNPVRDQQIARKAYVDSMAGGSWTPKSVHRLVLPDFTRFKYGSISGTRTYWGTRFTYIRTQVGTFRGYVKLGWDPQATPLIGGGIGEGLPDNRDYWRMTLAVWNEDDTGSSFTGVMVGQRHPYLGSDYLPKAGSNSLGIVFRGSRSWGVFNKGGSRWKFDLGAPLSSVSHRTPRYVMEFGSFGAKWWSPKGTYKPNGSLTLRASLGTRPGYLFQFTEPGTTPGIQLSYFAFNRRRGLASVIKTGLEYLILENLDKGTW